MFKKDGSHYKFPCIKVAAVAVGATPAQISASTRHKTVVNKSYRAVKADEVEIKTEDGQIKLDEQKIKGIINEFQTSNKAPVYAIAKDGSYKRFESQSDAGNELNLNQSKISAVTLGKTVSAGGYTFVCASEMEKKDEFGNTVIDNDVLQKAIVRLRNIKYVYAIHQDGSIEKFDNIKGITDKYGYYYGQVYQALKGSNCWLGDMVLAYSRDVEKQDKNGHSFVDFQKIEDLKKIFKIKSVDFNNLKRNVYMLDEEGKYTLISPDDIKNGAYFDYEHNIIQSMLGKTTYFNGYVFTPEENVVSVDSDNNKIFDNKKADEIIQFYAPSRSKVPVYAVLNNGNYKRYDSISDASAELGVSAGAIRHSVNKYALLSGYVFVLAKDTEKNTENGEVVLDEEKLKSLNNAARNNKKIKNISFYVVTKDGKYMRFNSIRQAEAQLKVSAYSISKAFHAGELLDGKYVFVPSEEVDSYGEEGHRFVDKQVLIQKYKDAFLKN